MKKRLLCALLCAVLLAGLIPAAALTASAATAEGDWTVYRTPKSYEDEKNGETVKPAPGYRYTADGFTTVEPDWTTFTPYFTVQTKEAQPLKDGIYLEFRVDEYPYGGEDGGADHWLSFSLSDRENVYPGNIDFGNNWLGLIRGAGDGLASVQSIVTTRTTDEAIGTFHHKGNVSATVPMDGDRREIYTLEITWDGSEYDVKVCGTTVEGCADITAKLEEWNADGEFFVGITVHAAVKDASAGITVTKFGTTAANATTPVGSDSTEPELDEYYEFAPIADPDTVPVNTPAIRWSPDTVNMKDGYNSSFKVLGDNTWHVRATDLNSFFYFTPKHSWSYAAENFPVFGILLRNFWSDGGTLWYCAGDILQPENACTVPFSIYDGEFYGEKEEYVFIPVDLSDLWEGRIHNVRTDFMIGDENAREFDICFAGMFRNKDEAYAYAREWLKPVCGLGGETSAYPSQDCDGEPTEPPYEPPVSTEPPVIWETVLPDETEIPAESLIDREQAVEDILAKYGCGSVIGFSAAAILAAAAAAVALKKRD